ATKRTAAVDDNWRRLVTSQRLLDPNNVRHVLRCGHTRLSSDVQGSGNVPHRVFLVRTSIEHCSALIAEDAAELPGAHLRGSLTQFSERRLKNRLRWLGAEHVARREPRTDRQRQKHG